MTLHLLFTFVFKLHIYRMERLSFHKGSFTKLAWLHSGMTVWTCQFQPSAATVVTAPSKSGPSWVWRLISHISPICPCRSICSLNTHSLRILPLAMFSSRAKDDIFPQLHTPLYSYLCTCVIIYTLPSVRVITLLLPWSFSQTNMHVFNSAKLC